MLFDRDQMPAIVMTLERIPSIGEETGEIDKGSQEIASSTEEQSATIQEIAASVERLNIMAQELEDLVSKFRV